MKEMIAEHEVKMQKTIEDLHERLSTIRTGKASVNMLNNITELFSQVRSKVK